MKYNLVLTNDTNKISGINNILLDDMNNIVNGTASLIMCEILDQLEYEKRIKILSDAIRKISFGGEVVIKFLNIYKICKELIKGNVNSKSFSSFVSNSNSVFLESDIFELISKTPHINIHKLYNSDNHIIVHIQKVKDE